MNKWFHSCHQYNHWHCLRPFLCSHITTLFLLGGGGGSGEWSLLIRQKCRYDRKQLCERDGEASGNDLGPESTPGPQIYHTMITTLFGGKQLHTLFVFPAAICWQGITGIRFAGGEKCYIKTQAKGQLPDVESLNKDSLMFDLVGCNSTRTDFVTHSFKLLH